MRITLCLLLRHVFMLMVAMQNRTVLSICNVKLMLLHDTW